MTIDNISIQEYFELEDTVKYDIFLEHMNPENLFCGRKCNTSALTFDEVAVTRTIFSKPNPKDLCDLYIMLFDIRGDINNPPIDIFLKESVFQLFRARNFLKEFIISINKKELEWLSGESNDVLEMLNAGERLEPFNHQLKKIDLAQMFAKDPSEIGGWRYSKVFSILVSTKVRAEIQKEFNEIK